MGTFSFIVFIICAVASVAVLTAGIIVAVKAVKASKIFNLNFKDEIKKEVYISCGLAAVFALMLYFIYPMAKIEPTGFELFATIAGGLLTGFLINMNLSLFILHYYGQNSDKAFDNKLFYNLAVAFPLLFVAIMLLTDGFAMYVAYPLVNSLNFAKGFVNVTESVGGRGITFYSLCILSGAIYVYILCDHKFYLNYGKHGILESTFIVAFPAGIIGARLFYVIGQWESEFAHEVWWKPFAIWEGGLTILGGALMGVVVGVAWFLWRNKKYNIWVAVDIIVPTILIAQAVGRWGNFFNTEVHGVAVDVDTLKWLPTFIWRQMQYGQGCGSFVGENFAYVPLFLYEGMLNLLGYFILAHLFGDKLRKYTQWGDLAFGYFIWYGLVRALLEPLRHEDFVMTDLWSFYWSLCFMGIGTLCIIFNHLIRSVIDVKKGTYLVRENSRQKSIVGMIGVLAAAIVLTIIGVIFAINSDGKPVIGYSNFNIALIIFVIAGCMVVGLIIPIFHLKTIRELEMKGM